MLPSPNWKEWYRFRHQQHCDQTGDAFESYVSSIFLKFPPSRLREPHSCRIAR